MRELPVVALNRCIACGDCVAICPVDCLDMSARGPWMPRPLACVSCSACALVCPADAIQMRKE